MLVVEPFNLRYLTGFTGTNGLAVVGAGADGVRRFVTDFRYVERAEARGRRVRVPARRARPAGQRGRRRWETAAARCAWASTTPTSPCAPTAAWRELLGDRVELVGAGGLVEELRAVKDADEQRAIAAAAALADEALTAALARGLAGRTERAFALDLEDEIRHRGAQAPSLPVDRGRRARTARSRTPSRATSRSRAGRLVVVDWGAQVDGYCSDCTRTFATGPLDGEATEVYELVLARPAGRPGRRCAPGATGREVDAVARELIDAAGHGEHFGHGLGHGVGLEVHEGPRLSKAGEDTLAAGNVVTVEPGVYLPGKLRRAHRGPGGGDRRRPRACCRRIRRSW